MLWSVVLVTVARGGCLAASDVATLSARLEAAERAYVDLDSAGFDTAMDDAALLLPCLAELAPTPVAARYHRMEALRLYGAGEPVDAEASLRAARALEPAYVFSDELLPKDHELRRRYESLDGAPGDERRPAQPREGALAFDGLITPRHPLDRATIVQLVGQDGIEGTKVLRPGDPLPPFDARPRTRTRLVAASGALLAASAAFYGLAWTTHPEFWDPSLDVDRADLARYQSTSRTFAALSGASLGLGGIGLVASFAWADSGRAPPGARW